MRAAIEAAHAAPVLAMLPDDGDTVRNTSVLSFPEAQGSDAAAAAVLSAPPPTFTTVAAAAAAAAAASAAVVASSATAAATKATATMPTTPASTPVVGPASRWWDSKAQPALAAVEAAVRGLKGETGDDAWAAANAEVLAKAVPLPESDSAPAAGAPQTEATVCSLRARLALHAVLRTGLASVAHFEARARRAARLLRAVSLEALASAEVEVEADAEALALAAAAAATATAAGDKGPKVEEAATKRVAVQAAMVQHLCSFFAHSPARAEAALRALMFLGVVRADAVASYVLSAAAPGTGEAASAGLVALSPRGRAYGSLHAELLLSALSARDLRRSDAWRLAGEGLPPKPGDENEGVTEAVVAEAQRKLDADEAQAREAFDSLLSGLTDLPPGDAREWIVESVMSEVCSLPSLFCDEKGGGAQLILSLSLSLSLSVSLSLLLSPFIPLSPRNNSTRTAFATHGREEREPPT